MIKHKNCPKRCYSAESLVKRKDKWILPVRLNNQKFNWTMANISKTSRPVWIAYFNPSSKHHLKLCEAMAYEMAKLFIELNSKIVVMPASHKSEESINKAIKIASKKIGLSIKLIRLLGTKRTSEGKEIVSEDFLMRKSAKGFVVSYMPITSPNNPKLLGIYPKDVELLRRHYKKYCQNGEGLVLADDAFTSGNTIKAVQKIVNKVLGLPMDYEHPVAVLAEEVSWDENYFLRPLPSNLIATIRIPKIEGNLENVKKLKDSTPEYVNISRKEVLENMLKTKAKLSKFLGYHIYKLPKVFPPSTPSKLLAQYINIKTGAKILDMGTGTGILAVVAGLQSGKGYAADINSEAVKNAKINLKRYDIDDIKSVKSDLFSNIPDSELFDLIIFQRPFWDNYGGKTMQHICEKAFSDPEGKMLCRFLLQAKEHLKKNGEILITIANWEPLKQLEKIIKQHDYKFKLLGQIHGTGDERRIYRVYQLKNKNYIKYKKMEV